MAIVIPILTEFSGKGIAKAKAEFQQLEGFGAKAGFILKNSMLPIAGLLAGVGTAAFQAGQELLGMAQSAAEDQKSQKQLADTLQASTQALNFQIAAVEDYIDKTARATGIADDKLRPAFGRLVRSTKDVEQAQRLLNLSLDIAGQTGKPLESIVGALGRAYDGTNGAIGRLGIGIDQATLKGMEFEELQKRLEKQFKGGAAAAADTYEGKMAKLRVRFDEFKESIGYKLLPYLEKLADKLIKISDAFGENGLAGAMIQFRNEFPTFSNVIGGIYDTFVLLYDMVRRTRHEVGNFWKLWGRSEFQSTPRWAEVMAGFQADLSAPKPNAPVNVGGGLAGPAGGVNMPQFTGIGAASRVGSNSLGDRSRPQQVNVTVTSADPRAVVDALVKYNRQNGAIPVTVGR